MANAVDTTPVSDIQSAARVLADTAAFAVAEPRKFQDNFANIQQRLGQAVARVREAVDTGLIEVAVRCDDPEGNDAWEESLRLPFVPDVGDTIEVWVDYDKVRETDPDYGYVSMGGYPHWLVVKDIIVCSYAPERVEVWVSSDGHSDDDMRRIFSAIKRGDRP